MCSKDVRTLVRLELEENPKVRALVCAYEELTETEKALFRVASGISQDTAGNGREHRHRSSNEQGSGIAQDRIQPYVQDLMKTLLEDYPSLLSHVDILNLLDRDYCKNNLGFRISNYPLLRRLEQGSKDTNGYGRYYVEPYAGKFYVCSQWWPNYHVGNAKSLLRFVTELAQRNPEHPGLPALERHRKTLRDYIG